MSSRDNNAEEAAAQAVSRVVGGTYAINDTGSEPGQYDVRITMPNKSTIALEVTSYGGDTWKRTVARIRAESKKGKHSGEDLKYQWWVVVPTGIGISELQPRLGELLARLEAAEKEGVASDFDGDDATLTDVAAGLRDLRVNSVNLWEESPPEGQPHILLSQSMRVTGTAGSLPGALAAVFEKVDNQKKLERADADERHLYVVLEDGGSAAVLEGVSPLPACPSDPKGVIDVLWVYSPSVSAYLFRTQAGTADWERFVAATGEPAPPE